MTPDWLTQWIFFSLIPSNSLNTETSPSTSFSCQHLTLNPPGLPPQFLFLLFVLFQSLNVIIGSSVLDPLFLVISATFGFCTVWLLLFGALSSCVSLVAVAAVVPSPVDDFCSGPCFHVFVGFIGVSLWTLSVFLKNTVQHGQGTPPAWAFTSLLSGHVAHLQTLSLA